MEMNFPVVDRDVKIIEYLVDTNKKCIHIRELFYVGL